MVAAGFVAAAGFTVIVVAVIVYSMVTFDPTLRSPVVFVLLSIAISHLSVPFCTVTTPPLTARTAR